MNDVVKLPVKGDATEPPKDVAEKTGPTKDSGTPKSEERKGGDTSGTGGGSKPPQPPAPPQQQNWFTRQWGKARVAFARWFWKGDKNSLAGLHREIDEEFGAHENFGVKTEQSFEMLMNERAALKAHNATMQAAINASAERVREARITREQREARIARRVDEAKADHKLIDQQMRKLIGPVAVIILMLMGALWGNHWQKGRQVAANPAPAQVVSNAGSTGTTTAKKTLAVPADQQAVNVIIPGGGQPQRVVIEWPSIASPASVTPAAISTVGKWAELNGYGRQSVLYAACPSANWGDVDSDIAQKALEQISPNEAQKLVTTCNFAPLVQRAQELAQNAAPAPTPPPIQTAAANFDVKCPAGYSWQEALSNRCYQE